MAPSTRILIAGAGDVGLTLGAVLSAADIDVTTLNRSGRTVDDVKSITADLTDVNALRAALGMIEPFDVVVFTTAPDDRNELAYKAAYVDAPHTLLTALAHHPTRAVLTSTTGVYGDDDGRWITASSPAVPARPTATIVLEGERALAGQVPTVSIRASGIYGPGRTSLINRVRRGGVVTSPASAPHWTNRIHRDDLVAALAIAAIHPSPPAVAIAVDDEPVPMATVALWLAAELGVTLPVDPAPDKQATGKRCRNSELKDLGWEPAYPTFREGYRSLLANI
jgi:nucleoside-diphosphate-sugar epimerase